MKDGKIQSGVSERVIGVTLLMLHVYIFDIVNTSSSYCRVNVRKY